VNDAPLTLWVTLADPGDAAEEALTGLYIQADRHTQDAVEYIRKDVVDAWLAMKARDEHADFRPPAQRRA
jgi:hypothetical protein